MIRWIENIANIWNVLCVVTDEPESSLQGVGLLGALGVGLIKSITHVSSSEHSEVYNPDPELVEKIKSII